MLPGVIRDQARRLRKALAGDEGHERRLTQNEINLARKIFGSSIDYTRVKIHPHGYTFFQPKGSGMTPNGEIYFEGSASSDFGLATAFLQTFFIHEMTHVWQKQNGV